MYFEVRVKHVLKYIQIEVKIVTRTYIRKYVCSYTCMYVHIGSFHACAEVRTYSTYVQPLFNYKPREGYTYTRIPHTFIRTCVHTVCTYCTYVHTYYPIVMYAYCMYVHTYIHI